MLVLSLPRLLEDGKNDGVTFRKDLLNDTPRAAAVELLGDQSELYKLGWIMD
jgi:hypothetical protein